METNFQEKPEFFENSLIAVSLLREIAQAIAQHGPESALRFLVESAVSISEAVGAILLIPHEKSKEMLPVVELIPAEIDRKNFGDNFFSLCYKVYLEGSFQYLTSEEISSKIPELQMRLGYSLAIPVKLAGKPTGLFFAFGKPDGKPFRKENEYFFEILTPFMGTLLENSRLQTEMIHKNSRLSALYEISQKAESLIDLRDVYDSLGKVIKNFIDCDNFTLYIISPDKKFLEARNPIEGSPFPAKILFGEGPIGTAAKELKPQLTFSEEFKSILILPMVVSGKLVGVVVLASRKSYAYRDEDIIGLRIITTQIASIDELFKNLVRLRSFTEAILQTMTSGVVIFDDMGKATFSNVAMTRIVGQPIDEGWSPFSKDLSFPENLRKMIEKVLENKTSVEFERIRLEDSSPSKTLEINAFPFRDESGITLGTAFFLKDITQQVNLEERLKRTDRLSALGVLAAGIAHEIRNPLTGMKMIVQLLISEFPQGDPKREPLGIIQNEIDRLERLIVNLLDFARPGKPQAIEISLHEILEACLLLVQNQINKTGLVLEKIFEEPIPKIVGDPDQLKQVFLNILTNAIQASKKGGKIIVKIRKVQGFVVVSISDTGVGIPKERQKIIFDPFVTTKDDGTGLGLSVALRIIEEHNGKIEVESAVGEGSTFSVFLPSD